MKRARRSLTPLRKRSVITHGAGLLAVFDSLQSGLLLLGETGNIVFANRCAAELLQSAPRALERRVIADVVAPLEQLLSHTAGADAGGDSLHGVSRGVRHTRKVRLPTGRLIDVGYTLAGIESQEFKVQDSVRYVLTLEDVTAVRCLQEERDRLLKLATVGETLPSLLHELKNPLAAIASSVELLIEEASDPALQKDLYAILTEVRRTVLSLDGIGAVGGELASNSPSAVDHAILEACTVLKSRAVRAGLKLLVDVPVLPLLHLEPAIVRAIVFNLVTNAIHACTERGKDVQVRVRLDPIGKLKVTVKDDGTGMDPDVLAHCTDLFFTTKRSGSGIGLALVKRLVEHAGGTLAIASQRDAGTQIGISIPLPRDAKPVSWPPRAHTGML